MLPPLGFESLRKETFDPTEYSRWVRTFEAQHAQEPSCGSASQRALRSSWMAHQPTIHTVVTSLEKLAEVLQSRTFPYVICHADLQQPISPSDLTICFIEVQYSVELLRQASILFSVEKFVLGDPAIAFGILSGMLLQFDELGDDLIFA